MKTCLIAALALGCLVHPASAQDAPGLTNSTSTQKISYALGMEVVRALRVDDFDIDMKAVTAGVADMQAGKAALSPDQQKAAMHEMREAILAKAVAKKEAAGIKHRQEGEAFLAANATREGVKLTTVVAPDGSKAGLQYKVLKSGPAGSSPKMTDSVVVRFTGSLLDGTVIDSSEQRGGPVTMQMKEVLPGWAAALQMMRPGDQWQLFIPPSLAYADYGPPEIGMYTTLIYQLELVSFSASETNPAPSSGSQ